MSNTNTIAGWVLAGGIAALGLSVASNMYFHVETPEKAGWHIEGGDAHGVGAKEAAVPIATLLATADVAKGESAFKSKCTACHTIAQGGANGVGPNLWGTMGKPLAGHAGFAFSEALKGVGGNWDFDKMSAWLESPRKFADGTKMTFAGIGNAEERAAVIAYLNTQGSNLPLPAAAAAATPAEENAAAGADPANVANEAGLAPGAPSQDPAAAEKAAAH